MLGEIAGVNATAARTASPLAVGWWTGTGLMLALAIAAVGGAAAATTFRAFDLDRFFVPKELALHVAALFMAVTLAWRDGPRRRSRVDVVLLAWLAASVVSAVFATSWWLAVRALAVSLSGAMVFWAAASLQEAGRSRGVGRVLALAATVAAASSLAQAYGISSDMFSLNRAPGGLLGNRNFVAHVAAMALPLLAWLAATTQSARGGVIGALALLISAAALVLSRSRAAWLSIAIWLAVAAVAVWRSRDVAKATVTPRRVRSIAVGVVAGVILALIVPNSLDWRSDSPYLDSVKGVVNFREGSGAGRVRQYTNSLALASAHPLVGVGPGNWAAEYPTVAGRNDPSLSDATGMASNPWPSSDWVAAVAERGVPAALALVTLSLLLLWQAWLGWRDPLGSASERLAALAGGSVVLIAAIEGMFDAVSLLALPSVIVFGAAGALIPPHTGSLRKARSARARIYITGAAAVLWLGIVAISVAKIEAMKLYTRGTVSAAQTAARLDPGSYRVQMHAAELLADRGLCREAYHKAMAARGLFPHATGPKAILARCAGAER